MEQTDDSSNEAISLSMTDEIINYLSETARWAYILAIFGYVGIGIIILIGLFMVVGFSAMPGSENVNFPMGLFGIIYFIIAAIYYFPVKYCHQFAVKMKEGIKSNDITSITLGFANLKSLYKFMGILMIVVFSIYGLILLLVVPTVLILKG